MQAVANMDPHRPLRDVADHARRVESLGYDALHVAETVHDVFQAALLALEHTSTLVVRTSVAVAFPRSPMVTAYAAWELARFSGGRFQLGLGTQIRSNIEDRYSAPWEHPVDRMREYIESLRAIFRSFATGDPLRFDGRYYRFSRLQPYFNPGPMSCDPPAIWLGGVNERMCRLAGELADGFVTHPTNSHPRYLETVCVPKLREGATAAVRSVDDLVLVVGGPLVTGPTASDVARAREQQRRTLAFLYSTPAYRRTLELFGWAGLAEQLLALTREQRWDELTRVLPDDVLDTLVLQAVYDDLPDLIRSWYGDVATGVLIPVPADPGNDDRFRAVIEAVRSV
jgi:probable F420-dependent oxidoreductase